MLTPGRRGRTPVHPDDRSASPADWGVVAAAGLFVFLFLAAVYPLRGYFFPVGPDTPVYLWWTNLAAHDGLSAIGTRPGVPDMVLVIGGTLHLSRVEVLAGLGVAGGVSVGLASGALADLAGRTEDDAVRRMSAAFAVVLAGTFAVHLADGFFANLIQAGLFLGAVAALAAGRRGTAAGGALLAASALTHPLFFLLSIAILAVASIPSLVRREPEEGFLDVEGGRALAAIAGGGALAGAGFLALLAGPGPPPHVDTSQDAFLRRAGLNGLLRREYRGRFLRHLARYVLPAQVPLAVGGAVRLWRRMRFVDQFLLAWAAILVLGVTVSLLTNLVPAVRLFASGYVVPILAAFGIALLYRAISRRRGGRTVALAVVVALVVAIVLGAAFTWLRARPFLSRTELDRAAVAGRIAEQVPAGTPLVFVVENERRNVSFLATRAGNVIRAAVPAARIRDVFLYVGSPANYLRDVPTALGPIPHDTMSRLYLRDIHGAGGRPVAFVLAPFNRSFFDQARTEGDLVSPGVIVLDPHPSLSAVPSPGPPGEVPPSSGWRLALASLATVALLVAVGWGWSSATVRGPASLALAPAFGMAGLVLGGAVFDRLGAPLTGWGPWAVSAAVGSGGYLEALRRRRREAL